jgi:hypothetical protein
MSVRKLMKYGLILAVSTAMFGCGGGGGGGGVSPTSSTGVTISGAAIKDYIIGASVYVYDVNGTRVGTGQTGEKGKFSVKVPANAKGPYLVIVKGGKLDKDGSLKTTNDTVEASNLVLAAPISEEAVENEKQVAVSPVTTSIVVSATGKGIDEIAEAAENGTVAEDIIEGIKGNATQVEKMVNSLSSLIYVTDKAVEKVESSISEIVQAVNATSYTNGTFDPGALGGIVEKIAKDIADGNLDGKANGVSVGYDDENKLQEATQKVPSIKATGVEIGGVGDTDLTDGLQIENASEDKKEIYVYLDITKAAYNNTYTTDFIFEAKGTNGDKRSIKAVLKNVTVSIDESGKMTVTVPENAVVEVEGTNSKGEPVKGTIKNISKDVIESESPQVIRYDLSVIENRLKQEENSDLADLANVVVGGFTYDVTLDVKGLPGFFPIKGTVSVVSSAGGEEGTIEGNGTETGNGTGTEAGTENATCTMPAGAYTFTIDANCEASLENPCDTQNYVSIYKLQDAANGLKISYVPRNISPSNSSVSIVIKDESGDYIAMISPDDGYDGETFYIVYGNVCKTVTYDKEGGGSNGIIEVTIK